MMGHFINFEETQKTLTDKKVNVMNELSIDVKNEDVNEFIEFYSAPLSNAKLIATIE